MIKKRFEKHWILLASTIAVLFSCADYDLLSEQDAIPDPVALEIVAVTDSSVALRWSQCHHADFRQYAVYYGTQDVIDNNDKLADSLSFVTDTVKKVWPLDELTRYYFRVMVTTQGGLLSASNTVDTVTLENMRGKLQLFRPELKNDGAIAVRWTAALVPVDRYLLYGDTLATVDASDSLLSTVYSDTAKTVSGLAAGKTWYLRVYAYNDTTRVATSNRVDMTIPAE